MTSNNTFDGAEKLRNIGLQNIFFYFEMAVVITKVFG